MTTALADRYEVTGELGAGGMATVYLARRRSTGGAVALKVFRPDVAMALGAERFLREIELAGRLEHPNIVPLEESGREEAAGQPPLLYYTMPYIEGESLADRIAREGQLTLPDVIAIARGVAAALQHAHSRGIVHRDVKPANILLGTGEPLVADFGIAHAVGQTGEQKLTSTGCVVGTPAYMSPEQAAGSMRIDGRSDIYALGCVVYEMLVGEPPFGGPSTQAVLARHAVGQVPSLRVVRPELPDAVEAAVHRALAKSPADRFRTADEFVAALAAGAETSRHSRLTPAVRSRPWLVPALVVLVLVAAGAAIRPWTFLSRTPAVAIDPSVIAVVPFGVAAGADDGAGPLAAGMAGLVVDRLPGGDGPRAIALAAADGDDAGQAARAAGAGRVLRGAVWSSGDRLALSATLAEADGETVLARVDRVAGPADSLPRLVDRLLAEVLLLGMGAPPAHVEAMAGLPLSAIRSYLAARADFLAGRFVDASARYEAVLRQDSTAYPAALGLATAAEVGATDAQRARGVRLARAEAARLDGDDRLLLNALAWAEPDRNASSAMRLAGFEAAAGGPRADADRWYLLGERLFHDGPLLGLSDVLERAAQSFRHAVEREPAFASALGHLIDLAARRGDTAEVRDLAARYFSLDRSGPLADYYRWRSAVALGDSATLAAARADFDSLTPPALERIVNVSQLDGVALDDALRASAVLWATSGVDSRTRWAFTKQRELALNRGRPLEAARLLSRQNASVGFRARDGLAEVVNALYWGADSAVPAAWVAEVGPAADRADAAAPDPGSDRQFQRCGVGLWRASRGDLAGARTALTRLSAGVQGAPPVANDFAPLCADLLSVLIARAAGAPDVAARLERLDSVAGAAPVTITWILVAANLTVADLWEEQGELDRALAAVRRRPYIVDMNEPRVLVGLSTMLREEGRLAALAGDTAAAATAYGRYLALRADAEPSLAGEVASVRRELEGLAR